MIIPFEIPHEEKEEGIQQKNLRVMASGNPLEGFPMVFAGPGSYVVGGQVETRIDLNSDYVYNLNIGNYCAIAHDVKFVIDVDHDYKSVILGDLCLPDSGKSSRPLFMRIKRRGQIIIQNDVWIGRGATIMGGVTIHSGAVVGAGAVVARDVAPYSIVVGNPARHIKYRFGQETIEKLLAIQWWYWTREKIIENAEWFSKEAGHFAEHFYREPPVSPGRKKLEIERYPNQFLYFEDMDEGKYSTTRKVITEFCRAFGDRQDCQLIVCLSPDENGMKHADFIVDMVADIDAQCSLYLHFGEKEDEESVFQYADYYITSRDQRTVWRSCLADAFGLKVCSGVDIPIFDDSFSIG